MIDIRGLRFAYPAADREVLLDIDWHAEPGTGTLLAGDSGSGKSTLLRCLNGLIPHFHGGRFGGSVYIAGRSTRTHAPRDLVTIVGTVFQDPESQIVTDNVTDEIVFTLEQLGVPRHEIGRRLDVVAGQLGIEHLLERETMTLSGGERQLVVLAGTLIVEPEILLLDEPTSQLDDVNTRRLADMIGELAERRGLTVLLAEHRFARVRSVVDTMLFLQNGRIDEPASSVLSDESGGWSTARLALAQPGAGELLMQVSGLTVEFGLMRALDGIDLEVREGDVLAITGPNGAGKTTLLRALAGIQRPAAGRVEWLGSASRRRPFAGFVPQNPTSILHQETLADELAFTLRAGGLGGDILGTLTALGIADHVNRHPLDLSGGERQRAAIAAISVGRPFVLLLDEPTRGLPVDEKVRLAEFVSSYAASGRAVVIATHDADFVANCATRRIDLVSGRVVNDWHPDRVSQVAAGAYAFDG